MIITVSRTAEAFRDTVSTVEVYNVFWQEFEVEVGNVQVFKVESVPIMCYSLEGCCYIMLNCRQRKKRLRAKGFGMRYNQFMLCV